MASKKRQRETSDRASAAKDVVDEYLSRLSAGEDLTRQQIIETHSDLLPELNQAFEKLQKVQQAVQVAERSTAAKAGAVFEGSSVDVMPPVPPEDSFPGYKLSGEVHRGGQGVVYHAVQTSTDRDVAIKVIRDDRFAGPNDAARFEREVKILARLQHPNIVAIHESSSAAGRMYFVMDYVAG